MQFMLLFSRQGKLRLQKWYVPLSDKEKKKITRELVQTVLARKPKMCSFLEWRDLKIVYKRYASLYFCCAIEDQDNELITLEIIHRYVELLDKYFGSVCELDIIFNFEKAYFILDEFLLGGEVQETSKKNVLKAIEQADLLQESQMSSSKSGIEYPSSCRTRAALKVIPPTLLHWAMMSEADGDMATEVEPSHQYSITFYCRITDGNRRAV
ncbi:AP-1 complex subunit sigma-2 isoform X1 [Gallus gallus]|uniref:AP-1 complex subunit sigma-2 isoform X1 n=1 Tax=Gallus gallus TaxID=9031 RepID=UPI001F024982|nr:AP-1 complex subunit sigma-2 isoform X1 [Gallus gallus]XP_046763945.1 AP-1 complex subunit sigma-2 isoform X1 [Gallus gallus]XP_046763946.1 AP-1 complex subunit sigma-2 isoform X1 [Gallus gallus]XP_046763947.1 AP-1 complex subunit sigma-2 isoform X1 [Gallus gallus]XP_046763948.1 AP-1 complex subunit sigma-2 isoform X1 [Gallus gallus]